MAKFKDLTGQRFGRLIAIKQVGKNKKGCYLWECRCDCGNSKIISSEHLKSGHTKSCGCLQLENSIKQINKIKGKYMPTTHGKTHTRLYKVWEGMKHRCYNKNNKRYHCYGGRGIKVCEEWLNNFQEFYNWAYKNGYDEDAEYGKCTIDRIDVNGNYEPSNCRWVDMKVQNNNRTTRARSC